MSSLSRSRSRSESREGRSSEESTRGRGASSAGSSIFGRKKKRENVVNASDDFYGFEKVIVSKTKGEQKAILQVLQQCYVFETLDVSIMQDIVDVMKKAQCRADQSIITQHEKGDLFYVILEGQAQVIVDGNTVFNYDKPSFFGELALMYNAPRAATVQSITPCSLFTLDLRSFRFLLSKTAEDGLLAKCSFLKKIPMFKDFPDMMVSQIATAMIQQSYPQGSFIITEGEAGEDLFILKDGTVKCTSSSAGDLVTLSTGEYFGEMAIMLDEPRQANCIAESEVVCYVISRETFDQTIGQLSDVQDRITRKMRTRILGSVPVLHELTEEELSQVSHAMKVLHVPNGKSVYKEGEPGNRFYIINSGSVLVTKSGQQEPVSTLGTNDFFGETSLLTDRPREYTVTASDDVELLVLSQKIFLKLVAPAAGESFPDLMAKRKSARTEDLEVKAVKPQYGMNDLQVGKTIGTGTFGRVKVVTITDTGEVVAMKCMNKSQIITSRQEKNVIHETSILGECSSPFIINQLCTFQSKYELYIILEIVQGGELWTYIYEKKSLLPRTRCGGFTNETSQFYAACVTSGLSHLSDMGVAYRDLKPENLLMDRMGYIKIIDFGFAKHIPYQKRGKEYSKTFTLCGTPEYLAPELVLSRGHDKCADYWALGCLIYELIRGTTPFQHESQQEIFRRIIHSQRYLSFSSSFDKKARAIVGTLLVENQAHRLGNLSDKCGGIMNHAWFNGFDWDALHQKTLAAPYVPTIASAHDTSCFDEYAEETRIQPYNGDQKLFKDFGPFD